MKNNTRILDIDLDFFLDNVVYQETNSILNTAFNTWPYWDVDRYLQINCGVKEKTIGKCVNMHHEVFFELCELIKVGKISTPVDWVHIDAHSDLGYSTFSFYNIDTNLCNEDISESNYMQYLITRNLINSLTNVYHEKSKNDINYNYLYKENGQKYIGISCNESNKIIFHKYTCWNYFSEDKFDFIFLSRSKNYTPSTAQILFDYISEKYINNCVIN